jgi:hypothetical protein
MRDALRIGKWVKADLLVVGEFRANQKQAWELNIEGSIIRADKSTVESTLSQHGINAEGWLPAIESLA